MNDYLVNVENGTAKGDSVFYTLAYDMLDNECKRLRDFTDSLDKEPNNKKEKIAEYKCAKYRLASLGRIFNLLYYGNNVYRQSCKHIEIDNCLKHNKEILSLIENADLDKAIDMKLYYGISIYINECLSELNVKLKNANDFEKIELQERIDGLKFAKDCLDLAWSNVAKDYLPLPWRN